MVVIISLMFIPGLGPYLKTGLLLELSTVRPTRRPTTGQFLIVQSELMCDEFKGKKERKKLLLVQTTTKCRQSGLWDPTSVE
jgi:hypothetical protein